MALTVLDDYTFLPRENKVTVTLADFDPAKVASVRNVTRDRLYFMNDNGAKLAGTSTSFLIPEGVIWLIDAPTDELLIYYGDYEEPADNSEVEALVERAETAATDAEASKADAETAKTGAEAARDAAVTAQAAAEAAADRAETAAGG